MSEGGREGGSEGGVEGALYITFTDYAYGCRQSLRH